MNKLVITQLSTVDTNDTVRDKLHEIVPNWELGVDGIFHPVLG